MATSPLETIQAVPIGTMVVSGNPQDVLVAFGLGSCVAVCLYDPVLRVGGMLHALLPTLLKRPQAPNGHTRPPEQPLKFVDQGIPLLIEAMEAAGARRSRLVARLCGGARMLVAPGFNDSFHIGQRNVQTAESVLQAQGIHMGSSDTGGTSGRTVKLHVVSGRITIKTLGQGEQTLV